MDVEKLVSTLNSLFSHLKLDIEWDFHWVFNGFLLILKVTRWKITIMLIIYEPSNMWIEAAKLLALLLASKMISVNLVIWPETLYFGSPHQHFTTM